MNTTVDIAALRAATLRTVRHDEGPWSPHEAHRAAIDALMRRAFERINRNDVAPVGEMLRSLGAPDACTACREAAARAAARINTRLDETIQAA